MLPTDTLERLGNAFALTAPTERKRMLVIVNPHATTVSDGLKNLVVSALHGRYDVQAVDTAAKEHATQLAREAAGEGFDLVVAFGGDGTLNEVANGLAGSATPLTTLPGGSANVFGKMLGIPGDIVDATEHLLRVADDFRPRQVDLARVNARWFTFSAGMGLDAAVVARVDAHPRLKAKYGPKYFTAAAVSTFSRRYVVNAPRLDVEVDGDDLAGGVSVFVQNGDPYTYFGNLPIHVAEHSRLDSGRLAGAVLTRARLTDMPSIAFRAFSPRRNVNRARAVCGFHDAREVVARSADGAPIPLQVDGDYIGDVTKARFTLAAGKLTVVA
jgi:diacylglycerol kinase family enzyme